MATTTINDDSNTFWSLPPLQRLVIIWQAQNAICTTAKMNRAESNRWEILRQDTAAQIDKELQRLGI
jgi:hypothetical protein